MQKRPISFVLPCIRTHSLFNSFGHNSWVPRPAE
jgi:hypothetical protein